MTGIQIGCGQITWILRKFDSGQTLADIAQAGYAGAPAGPVRGQSTQEVLAGFSRHNLLPAPGYFGADFWDPSAESEILQQARLHAEFGYAAGLTEFYVAAGGFTSYTTRRNLNRMQIAGNVRPEDGLTEAEMTQFAKILNQVAEITLARGVRSCFHSHVGSVIETGEEIERLFAQLDPELIFMGPDSGHLLWGGVDPIDFCRRYATQIKTIHIKDVNQSVLEQGIAEEWDYMTFNQKGIWTELGQGCIDFPALFSILEQAGFQGWIIVETDGTQLATPLESALVSRGYLASLGY